MSTEATIYQTARAGGIPPQLAYIMVAQAKHETGGFTSNFFKKYNNAFGYSAFDGSKWQSGHGTVADNGVNIAAYRSIADSTNEIVDWIKRRQASGVFPADLNTITTPEQYAGLLKKANYYQDTLTNYTRGLNYFFLENPAWAGGGSLMIVLLLVGAYFVFKK